jgi:hypothetical protein
MVCQKKRSVSINGLSAIEHLIAAASIIAFDIGSNNDQSPYHKR